MVETLISIPYITSNVIYISVPILYTHIKNSLVYKTDKHIYISYTLIYPSFIV